MSKNSNYANTTQTLGVENRSLESIIFHPSKPVLDSELNLINDINSSKLQDVIRSKVPSGWLDAEYSLGNDNSSESFGINTLNDRTSSDTKKTIILNSKKSSPSLAVVNGWVIQVGGSNISDDRKLKITLQDGPVTVGYRTDLVFLEVWKSAISANPSSANKPSATKIFKYGNTQYADSTNNPNEEIINPNVGFATTSRIQIQYRLRVVSDVDFYTHPEGLDDVVKVFAQGSNLVSPTAATTYNTFINGKNSFDDSGLYIAGDGSSEAIEELGTVDGYVYAIPMLKVHRRNKVAFSLGNLNGSGVSIFGTSLSDRPDGLFYDEINQLDIEDLRHSVSFGELNYKEILDQNFDDLCSGNMKTCLTENQNSGSVVSRTNLNFKVDRISATGDNIIAQPNGQRRYFSDVSKSKNHVQKVSAPGTWDLGSYVSVSVEAPFPSGTRIGSSSNSGEYSPYVKAVVGGVVVDVNILNVNVSGSSAEFQIGPNPGLIGDSQDIFVYFQIVYPRVGDKFSKPLTEVLKTVFNNTYSWGFVSVNDRDDTFQEFPKRKKIGFTPKYTSFGNANGYKDCAYTYKFSNGDNRCGVGTVVSIFEKGNSTVFHTIPGNIINSKDLAYVVAVYSVDQGVYLEIQGQQRNSSTGELQIQVNSSASLGSSNTLRFDVAVVGGNIEYDERTQTLEDIAEVKMFSIKGNGSSSVILKGCLSSVDPENNVIGAQSMYMPLTDTYQTWCYVDGYYVPCNVYMDGSIVKLNFGAAILPTQQIDVFLLLNKAPTETDALDIYYNYKEYKGVVNRTGFSNTTNSYIKSKIVYQNDILGVVTCGTGAVNTAEAMPKSYEPLIPMLPLSNNVSTGVFTGTLHENRVILGGSYSIQGDYNTPYSCGKENFMSNEGGVKSKGASIGGTSVSTIEYKTSDDGINKLIVGKMVEMVTEDGTGHFLPGEIALKVETNYVDDSSTKNRITNSSSLESNNCFDMFKVKGRPLVKVR